jgi:hypothetical protein
VQATAIEETREASWVARTGSALRTPEGGIRVEVVLVALAVLAAAMVAFMNRGGLGGFPPDSAVYLSTAQHLRAGHGFTTSFDTLFDHFGPRQTAGFDGNVPLVAWAPGFPALLALLGFVGAGNDAANVVNIVCTGLIVFMTGYIVLRITRSATRAVIASIAIAIFPEVLVFSGIVMSETLFVTVALASILAAYRFAERPTAWRLAVVGGAGVLATMTRLAGVSVPVALGATVLVVVPGTWLQRVARGAVAGAPGVLFAVAWRSRDASSPIHWHPPGRIDLDTIGRTIGSWFGTGNPTTGRALGMVVVFGLFCLAMYTAFVARRVDATRALTVGLGFLTITSVVVVAIARTFTDAQVPFSARLLLPGIVSFVLLVASSRLERWPRADRVLAGVLIAIAVFALWPWSVRAGWYPSPSGSATTARAITSTAVSPYYPKISKVVRKLPPGRIVSDYPENTWFYADRASIHMPSKQDVTGGRPNADFNGQMREVAAVLRPGDFVVLYRCPSDAPFFPTVDEIRHYVTMTTVYEADDGCIFRVT